MQTKEIFNDKEWMKYKGGVSFRKLENKMFIDTNGMIHKLDVQFQYPRHIEGEFGTWMISCNLTRCGIVPSLYRWVTEEEFPEEILSTNCNQCGAITRHSVQKCKQCFDPKE